ncbi:MAG TPA: alpha/beta hydrolase-fold protein [Gemmatimonadaceae bacterium]|nr:alpha/beta hydrolase-fold protein [Gemmatimonadaceae bacterium]
MACLAPVPSAWAQPAPALTIGIADSLRSSVLGEWRRLHVYTPPSYREASRFPRRYPVLYLLDGEAYFGSAVAMLQLLSTGVNGTWALPEMVVVAIHSTNRRRDFTPTRITKDPYGRPLPPGWDVTGGNPRFLEFLSKELMPRIDSTYRTAPYRVYAGHSLGGLAVLNALFTTPDLFNAYVAIDPTLWMDDQRLVRLAPEYFRRPAPARRALFIAQGNNITPYDTGTAINHLALLRLTSIIQGENRSGIRYGYRFYEREDHGSIPFVAQYDALRWLFEGFEAHVPQAAAFPGFLTEHAEALSERLGYRVIPPAGLTAFVSMLSRMEPQGLSAPRDPMTRAMGTWVRDSATGADDRVPPNGETAILTPLGEGFHLVERLGGPGGEAVVSIDCPRSSASVTALAPGERRRCQSQVLGDSVVYTIHAERDRKLVVQEQGTLTTDGDGRTMVDRFTSVRADGRVERRRHVYVRLY